MSHQLVLHTGGCHCGAVRYEVKAPLDVLVYDCNCSICVKKQAKSFQVPHEWFKLLKGQENLTTYTFNTGLAKHTFCKICGVQSFNQPRSFPQGYNIEVNCLDPGTVRSVTIKNFDGEHWEDSMKEYQTHLDALLKMAEEVKMQ